MVKLFLYIFFYLIIILSRLYFIGSYGKKGIMEGSSVGAVKYMMLKKRTEVFVRM